MTRFHVGDVVRKLREERGWTQEELAEKAKVSVMTVSFCENNSRETKRANLDKIAAALGRGEAGALLAMATDLARHTSKGPSPLTEGTPHAGSREEIASELTEIAQRAIYLAEAIRRLEPKPPEPPQGTAKLPGRVRGAGKRPRSGA